MVERIPGPGPNSAISAPQPVRPAAPTERNGDPRLEAFQRTLATMLGSKVPVSVLSRLGDGSFMVQVAGTRAAMMLPAGTQPGAQLTMTVLAASPQPTFGLGDATLHGSPVPPGANAASLAAKLAAAASPLMGGNAGHEGADLGADSSADLSPAARLLSQVLQGAAPGPAAPIAGTAPLAPQGLPDPAQLAAQLQGAIAKSGLFYESHVAQWADGKRPMAELMAEPQAQKSPGTPPTEPATAQLINQQLATHESGHLAWQGQLGPGQPFYWDITRADGDEAHPDQPDAPGWESRLRLRFAFLGEVEAHISLRGNLLHVDLQAAGSAASLLREGAPRLQDALAAGGGELAALRIHGGDDT